MAAFRPIADEVWDSFFASLDISERAGVLYVGTPYHEDHLYDAIGYVMPKKRITIGELMASPQQPH